MTTEQVALLSRKRARADEEGSVASVHVPVAVPMEFLKEAQDSLGVLRGLYDNKCAEILQQDEERKTKARELSEKSARLQKDKEMLAARRKMLLTLQRCTIGGRVGRPRAQQGRDAGAGTNFGRDTIHTSSTGRPHEAFHRCLSAVDEQLLIDLPLSEALRCGEPIGTGTDSSSRPVEKEEAGGSAVVGDGANAEGSSWCIKYAIGELLSATLAIDEKQNGEIRLTSSRGFAAFRRFRGLSPPLLRYIIEYVISPLLEQGQTLVRLDATSSSLSARENRSELKDLLMLLLKEEGKGASSPLTTTELRATATALGLPSTVVDMLQL